MIRMRYVAAACVAALMAQGAFADSYVGMQLAEMQSQVNSLQKQVNSLNGGAAPAASGASSMVGTNATLSQQLNGDRQLVGQDMMILDAAKAGTLAQGLTLGGMLQADAMYAHTSSVATIDDVNQGVFNNVYFDSNTSTAQDRTAVTLTNAKLSAVAAMDNWVDAVVQLGTSYPGSATLAQNAYSLGTGDLQVQQAYLLLGNLNQTPFYGFIGNRYIDFGQFVNVNPFTQPLTREFFQAAGNTVGVGYDAYNFNVTASLLNGGTQNDAIYATNAIIGDNTYTRNNSEVNNFALNVGYGQTINNVDWHVGVGYLNGGSTTTAGQTNGSLATNPIGDLNAALTVGSFDFYGEYDYALDPSAQYSSISGTNFVYSDGAHAQGFDLSGDYRFNTMGYDSMASLSYGNVKNTTHTNDSFSQIVVGYDVEPLHNVWTGIEYAYQDGVVVQDISSDTGLPIYTGENASNNNITLDVKAYF